MLRVALVLAAAALLAAGCGGGATLDPALVQRYATAEARALCVVRSHAFETQDAQQAAYTREETKQRLTAGDIKKLRDAEQNDPAIRARITARYRALC